MATAASKEQPLRLPPFSSFAQASHAPAYSPSLPSPYASGSHPPSTPVFIPPLTPRTPSSASSAQTGRPVIINGRSFMPASASSLKRTAEVMAESENLESAPQNEGVSIKREPSETPIDTQAQVEHSQEQQITAPADSSVADVEQTTLSPRSKKKRKTSNAAANAKGTILANTRRKGANRPSPLTTIGPTAHNSDVHSGGSSQSGGFPAEPSPVSPIVMGFDAAAALADPLKASQVRLSINLMEQQKALIESRRAAGRTSAGGPSGKMQQAQHQQLQKTYASTNRDEEEGREAASNSSLANRRGDRVKKLTIHTPSQQEPSSGRTFSSIKSAPIRPAGYQNAVQNSQIPNEHSVGLNGHPLDVEADSEGGSRSQYYSMHRSLHPSQVPHTANDLMFSGGQQMHPRLPSMRDRPAGGPSRSDYSHIIDRQTSKAAFLSLFDTFYDSLADSRILQVNLEDQIRRSASLLNTMQQSSSIFENMLDKRMAEMCQSLTNDLQVLEGRIERLEAVYERNGVELPPLTPSIANLQAHSLASQQKQTLEHMAARSDAANTSASLGPASASISARLDRIEGITDPAASAKLSTHATSNLRGSG